MNRAEELRRAVKQAGLPSPAVRVYDALLSRADWVTGTLPDNRQPRSLNEVAKWAGLARSLVAEHLNVLESYGWIERDRPPELRHGLSTTYRLSMGRDRPAEVSEPLSGAERTRRYRERKRSTSAVTRDEHGGPIQRDERGGPIGRDVTDRSSVHRDVTHSEVSAGFVQWAAVGELSGEPELQDQLDPPLCIGSCAQPARRGCRTCWECAYLELNGSRPVIPDRRCRGCGAPVSPLRYAQAGRLCARCEATPGD